MKSIYFLAFVAAYLLYSAKQKGFHSDVSQVKVILAIVFLIIPAAYWLYDRIKGDRR